MLCLVLSRSYGLLIDGYDQPINIKELIFELVVLLGAVWLYSRSARGGGHSGGQTHNARN